MLITYKITEQNDGTFRVQVYCKDSLKHLGTEYCCNLKAALLAVQEFDKLYIRVRSAI